MTSIVKNFVTIKQKEPDVLSRVAYRSTVEALIPLINDFQKFNSVSDKFINHLTDTDDPHDEGKALFVEIIGRVYEIYVKMTLSPVSFNDFKTDILPTLNFVELIRRVTINRYLYNQVKALDGSVGTAANAVIGKDWDVSLSPMIPTTVDFPLATANENEFIETSTQSLSNGHNRVYDANFDVYAPSGDILFQTSSTLPYLNGVSDDYVSTYYYLTTEVNEFLNTEENEFFISEAKNYITSDILQANRHFIKHYFDGINIRIETVYNPIVDTDIISIGNANGNITLRKNADSTLDLYVNSVRVSSESITSNDNVVWLSFKTDDNISVVTQNDTFTYTGGIISVPVLQLPISYLSILVTLENLSSDRDNFGLRDVAVREGSL